MRRTWWQKSPLTSSTRPPIRLSASVVPIAEQLVRERIHATAGLAAADRADDRNAGEEAAVGDREPGWGGTRLTLCGVMPLADHEEEVPAFARVWIRRQRRVRCGVALPHDKNVRQRERHRACQIRRSEQHHRVRHVQPGIQPRSLKRDHAEHGIGVRPGKPPPAREADTPCDSSAGDRPVIDDGAQHQLLFPTRVRALSAVATVTTSDVSSVEARW